MFTPDGSIQCQTCGDQVASCVTEAATIQLALAKGWGLYAGTTVGGEPLEAIACRGCRGESRKRPVRKVQTFEDVPLFEE